MYSISYTRPPLDKEMAPDVRNICEKPDVEIANTIKNRKRMVEKLSAEGTEKCRILQIVLMEYYTVVYVPYSFCLFPETQNNIVFLIFGSL